MNRSSMNDEKNLVMKKEFNLPDASAFGQGPWENEPGRLEWRHLDMPCLLRRNSIGVWCGYVGITKDHPMYEKDYNTPDVCVHGGLTYANKCDGTEGIGICHIPEPGEDADLWWFGFDCGHFSDYIPAKVSIENLVFGLQLFETNKKNYRNIDFARHQTELLAEQLHKIRYEDNSTTMVIRS